VSNDKKPRILVVDDDKGLQTLVQTLLQRANMDPIVTGSAGGAAEVLKQQPLPDAVVLDLMLPDVSGIEFLRQMRSKKVFDALPVVILSALADPDQIREGLETGADRYLTKPYLANNLVSTLTELLRTGRRK
jgi:two-component system, OmpR family, phosphate regulon response regulator PhoB